jgi:hypothetical protein
VSGQHSADSIEYSPDIGQEGDSVTIVVGLIGVETTVEDTIPCMSDVKVVRKRTGTILSDGINIYFFIFFCRFHGLSSGT